MPYKLAVLIRSHIVTTTNAQPAGDQPIKDTSTTARTNIFTEPEVALFEPVSLKGCCHGYCDHVMLDGLP